jgi:hypothetical protein
MIINRFAVLYSILVFCVIQAIGIFLSSSVNRRETAGEYHTPKLEWQLSPYGQEKALSKTNH